MRSQLNPQIITAQDRLTPTSSTQWRASTRLTVPSGYSTMQQALRGTGPSPVPHIQHPPPNTSGIHQPQSRGYVDPSAAQIYEQQQRTIQQQQQQNQIQQHRDHQMASHRGLGIQGQQQQITHLTSIQHPQLPPRQMPMVSGNIQGGRQIRPPGQAPGWPHPTIPGARISDQQMQQYQLQLQQQQQGYAQTPQSQHQRALEQQHHQNQQHRIQQQQQLQQAQLQHQPMSHIPPGYRMAPGPIPPQLVHTQPMQQQQQQQQAIPAQIQQQLLRHQSVTSTPTRPPLSHALSYLETNTSALPPSSLAGPSSAGPVLQAGRAPSRQAGRSASPMPPPSVPSATPNMQASASASAIPSSSTLQLATLPPRSSTLPLPAPTRLPIGVAHTAVAGPSSTPSHTPTQTSRDLPTADEPRPEFIPPQRLALRETISERLKKHLARTEKQLVAAEKVERTLKRRKLGGRNCKGMSKDEKWRGKFDNLVLEYLEKGGYQSAFEGLKLDLKKEPSGVEMEKNLTSESIASGSRDGLLSGDSTLVEGENAKGEKGDTGRVDEVENDKTESAPENMEIDGVNDGGAVGAALDTRRDGGSATKPGSGGDLGKLFTWYTVQRFASQISTTLQSSAIREFRLATDIAESQSLSADGADPPLGDDIDITLCDSTIPVPTAPSTAQIPSSATATRIIVSAPHVAIRAASNAQDAERPGGSPIPLNQSSSATGLGGHSPNEMVGLTATFQKADTMRAAQEAQIREQQVANRAAAERAEASRQAEASMDAQARAQASGSSEPDDQQLEVRMGDQLVYMPRSEYNRLVVEEQHRAAQQQHMARSMGMVQQQQPQHPGQHGMMVQQQHAHEQQLQHQHLQQQQYQQQMMMAEGGAGPGSMKRGMDGEVLEGNKRIKMVRKPPTPEEHQRQAIEMATRARSMVPFMGAPGGQPPMGIQAASHRPGLPRHPSETDHQYALRQSEWVRQISASNGQIQQNPYQQSFGTGMTPASAATSGMYEDHATPQSVDVLSARAAGAGLVPSPTASRASVKKRPAAIGAGGIAEGEVTPTSARKKGGKRATKASAKGKKAKAGTPSSADGPVTPFTIPETPVANIAHTPSHPPGEFQPSDTGGSAHEQDYDGPTHQLDHQQQQQHQQLQVQLLHNRQHPHLNHGQSQLHAHPYTQHLPHQSQIQQHSHSQSTTQAGQGQYPVNGNTEASNGVFDGIGLDDDLLKALGGFQAEQTPNREQQSLQVPVSAGTGPGTGGSSVPQSATNFDQMGFDLDPNGGLNFDWDNVDFGNGDAWAT